MLTAENKLWRAVLAQAYDDAEMWADCPESVPSPADRIKARRYLRRQRPRSHQPRNGLRIRRPSGRSRRLMGAPPLQIRSLIGFQDVPSRKKQRTTNSDANAQTRTSDDAGVGKELQSDPMGTTHKANGHAPVTTTQHDIANFEHWAASDDASGHLVAETAPHAAACATRNAYAEMAPASAEGQRLLPPGAASRPSGSNAKATDKNGSHKKGAPDIPPATEPLPADGASFVEAVHEKVDLIELEVSLLTSEDEKIRQRELAYLRELKYGKSAAFSTDDESGIILDLPRPNRDLPANE